MLFFFNDTATTEIYTLSLHDALPILAALLFGRPGAGARSKRTPGVRGFLDRGGALADPQYPDRKSTRLNSSHSQISYAVFCLKKKSSCGWRYQPGAMAAHTALSTSCP